MATLAIGVTVPSASSCTGTDLLAGRGDLDRHRPLCLAACVRAAICRRAVPETADEHGDAEQRQRRHLQSLLTFAVGIG